MQDSAIGPILDALRSSRSREAWSQFSGQYSPLIFQVVHSSFRDSDSAADCFLFVCEQLSRDSFRRLLRFRLDGLASFPTWLRVVVHHICLDWHRKQAGRRRPFRSIARLPQLEGEVYRCRYERGLSLEETFLALRPNLPGLTREDLEVTEARVRESLSSRQLWLLNARRGEAQPAGIAVTEGNGTPGLEVADPRPNQESVLAQQEQQAQVRSAIGKLPKPDRLLIRLRFEQELSLEQIAGLTGLGDAQRVHRRIAGILDKLRREIT